MMTRMDRPTAHMRRSLWIAAEDCPDGEQIEETDLDVLLIRLPDIVTVRG